MEYLLLVSVVIVGLWLSRSWKHILLVSLCSLVVYYSILEVLGARV